jgi:hypothetical protein
MTYNRDFWPKEREGYSDNLRPAYAAVQALPRAREKATPKLEERLGSVIAGTGLCWATWVVVHTFGVVNSAGLWPIGPLETCALGILIWMHAKWRRFAKSH